MVGRAQRDEIFRATVIMVFVHVMHGDDLILAAYHAPLLMVREASRPISFLAPIPMIIASSEQGVGASIRARRIRFIPDRIFADGTKTQVLRIQMASHLVL